MFSESRTRNIVLSCVMMLKTNRVICKNMRRTSPRGTYSSDIAYLAVFDLFDMQIYACISGSANDLYEHLRRVRS